MVKSNNLKKLLTCFMAAALILQTQPVWAGEVSSDSLSNDTDIPTETVSEPVSETISTAPVAAPSASNNPVEEGSSQIQDDSSLNLIYKTVSTTVSGKKITITGDMPEGTY